MTIEHDEHIRVAGEERRSPVSRRPRRPPVSSGVTANLAEARRCLATALRATEPAERFAAAHLGALRAAAAMLATFPPPTTRTARTASVWARLDRVSPDLADWTAYFAAGSAKRQAAEAGITRLISAADAEDQLRRTAEFIDLVDQRLLVAA